jgi:hypothetical protein
MILGYQSSSVHAFNLLCKRWPNYRLEPVAVDKNQVMFGKIEHDTVYFLNSGNKFDKIELELLEQEDLFTKQAQEAYSLIR